MLIAPTVLDSSPIGRSTTLPASRLRPVDRSRWIDALVWPTAAPATDLVPTPGDRRLSSAIHGLRRRFGSGRGFVAGYRDHHLARLARLAALGPTGAVPLWLLSAVAVRASVEELADLASRDEVHRVEPMTLVTPPAVERHTPSVDLSGLSSRAHLGREEGSVRVAQLDTGIDPRVVGWMSRLVAFDAFGQLTDGQSIGGSAGHGAIFSSHLAGYDLACSRLAARALPGGSGTVAQVIGAMQWALEHETDIIVTPLGRSAFDAVWRGVSAVLTAAGISWVVSADEARHGTPRPTVHLPLIGCYRRGPLRTVVPEAGVPKWIAGPTVDTPTSHIAARAARVVAAVASLKALEPTSDPLALARLLWASGGTSVACPAPSWAA